MNKIARPDPVDTHDTRGGLPSTLPQVKEPLKQLYSIGKLMDAQFQVPVLGRVGLDPIIGLVPVVGDVATYVVSLYIIVQAGRLGVPAIKIIRMTGNTAIDLALGYFPLIGDFIDVKFKSNVRNVNIILDHFEAEIEHSGEFKKLPVQPLQLSKKGVLVLWAIILLAALLLAALIALPILLGYWIFSN